MDIDRRARLRQLLEVAVLAILLGGGSGVLATALTTNYLSEYARELGELTAPIFSETRPKPAGQSGNEATTLAREKLLPALAEFHVRREGQLAAYPSESPSFYGVVLTSDGWIALMPSGPIDPARFAVVVGRRAYAVEAATLDAATGVWFVKVDAGNLPVLAFGAAFDLEAGETLMAASGRDALMPTAFSGRVYGAEIVRASDIPSRRILLRDAVSPGLPIANADGELVALSLPSDAGRARALPIEEVLPAFRSLLRAGKISRPALGAQFIDLFEAAGLRDDARRGHAHGALLAGTRAAPAGSPAAKAGLRAGDIILSIDGQPVNGSRALDERLLDYDPGDTVTVSYDRAGETREVQVTLGP